MKHFVILSLILFASCSSEPDYTTYDDYQNYYDDYYYDDEGNLDYEVDHDNFTLDCQDGQCPSSVALIMMGRSGQCSGTLINKKYVLTNSHCLASYSKSSDCSNIKSYFIDNSGDTVQYRCSKIHVVHQLPEDKKDSVNDYALFELEKVPSNVDSVKISHKRDLPANNDLVNLYVTNVTSHSSGIIKHHECTNRHNTLLNISTQDSTGPLMALANCDVISGNSGSGILNTNNELVGIVFAGTNRGFSGISSQRNSLSMPQELGIGIQSQCLDLSPHIPSLNKVFCKDNTMQDDELEKALFMERALPALLEIQEEIFKDFLNDSNIHWKISDYTEQERVDILMTEGSKSGDLITPVCLKTDSELVYQNSIYQPSNPDSMLKLELEDMLNLSITNASTMRSGAQYNVEIDKGLLSGYKVKVKEDKLFGESSTYKEIPLCE